MAGERHGSESGRQFQDALETLACRGDVYLALEGTIEGKKAGFDLDATCGKEKTKKSLIYGLENELSRDFVTALELSL